LEKKIGGGAGTRKFDGRRKRSPGMSKVQSSYGNSGESNTEWVPGAKNWPWGQKTARK